MQINYLEVGITKKMTNCIFCKIISGEIPSIKIWEDEKHLAILDKFPNSEGQTLVIPKKHFNSKVTEMPDENYEELMIVVKKIAKVLEEKLNVERVAIIIEGLGVNHIHIKLYPLHNIKEGYITTQLGPEKSIEELNKIAEKIK